MRSMNGEIDMLETVSQTTGGAEKNKDIRIITGKTSYQYVFR